MKRIILSIIAFVLLVENFSTFLMLLISIKDIDAGTLNDGVLIHGLSEPQITGNDLELLWVFLGSVVIAGVALILVFVDMALFRTKYVKAGLILSGIHFVLMLSWIILGATVYSQPHAQGHIYFSVFINHLQPQLLLGGVASCLTFIALRLESNKRKLG